jgi:hypothetical protein
MRTHERTFGPPGLTSGSPGRARRAGGEFPRVGEGVPRPTDRALQPLRASVRTPWFHRGQWRAKQRHLRPIDAATSAPRASVRTASQIESAKASRSRPRDARPAASRRVVRTELDAVMASRNPREVRTLKLERHSTRPRRRGGGLRSPATEGRAVAAPFAWMRLTARRAGTSPAPARAATDRHVLPLIFAPRAPLPYRQEVAFCPAP